ncbi:RNA-binding protein with serine-rich domain 1 family protein [Necator americanus]|uniref:RNA-binding protein with serine-rich domain 1 family protein n=1 Tax=Necator americanus TaxID=51031 RepID=W2TR40_NECAM|nr:RNA-binding protein with serine-rich domain 1 family protein [Necator americanus]ETN83591.1 RNA-binding protein with serine-rich domain 1 family protein [Necator americanus]
MNSDSLMTSYRWLRKKKKRRSVAHAPNRPVALHHLGVLRAVTRRDPLVRQVLRALPVHRLRVQKGILERRYCQTKSLQGTTTRGRSRSPRRSPARARADRGAGDRPSRRSPSPRRRRVSPSPKRRADRSTSRGRRRSPRRASPRRASPRRSPKRSPRRTSPRKTSPSKRISIRNLSRNVTKEHLAEIFGMYGPIKSCDLPPERFYTHLHRGYGYVEYENAEDAEKALKYFDGGQIDGQVVSVELTLNRAASRRSPVRKSPVRRSSPGRRRSPPGRGANANMVPLGSSRFNRSRSRSPRRRRSRS